MTVQPSAPANPLPSLVRWVLTSAMRHVLTGFGGALVTAGAISSDQTAQFISIGTGVAVWAAGLAWSAAEKKALTDPQS